MRWVLQHRTTECANGRITKMSVSQSRQYAMGDATSHNRMCERMHHWYECSTEQTTTCVLARMSGGGGGAIGVDLATGVEGAGAPIGVAGSGSRGVPGCEPPNSSAQSGSLACSAAPVIASIATFTSAGSSRRGRPGPRLPSALASALESALARLFASACGAWYIKRRCTHHIAKCTPVSRSCEGARGQST